MNHYCATCGIKITKGNKENTVLFNGDNHYFYLSLMAIIIIFIGQSIIVFYSFYRIINDSVYYFNTNLARFWYFFFNEKRKTIYFRF
jgi:hypothetical protein